jgi:eukaryotic-like serine/threonine-protein kinase
MEHLYVKSSDGSGSEDVLPVARRFGSLILDDWSPDGRSLLFELLDETTAVHNLWVMPVTGDHRPWPFLRSDFNKEDAQFSPNGQWVAYASDESGHSEVFVQAFPTPGKRWQVSTNGGIQPRWRRDGKEVFFLGPDGTLMSSNVQSDGLFEASTPKPLFRTNEPRETAPARYAVSSDGQRFLVSRSGASVTAPVINVVVNWTASLEK